MKLQIQLLHVYMDDFYGFSYANRLEWFRGCSCPSDQVKLLKFWEDICCPFSALKQLHSLQLKIIGFWVDVNGGTITLAPEGFDSIFFCIDEFLSTPKHRPIL